uniref:Uncharacterized protein n=1 Tax=Lepeophtheirus salmonis TaxID=72036 RepID=A0A0K2TI21_LEPSM
MYTKGNYTGLIAFPFDATRPNIITEAGCLVVEIYRSSSATSPNVTTRSFCLLMTGSTVKVFSSEKITMSPQVSLRWFTIFFAGTLRTFFYCSVNKGCRIRRRDFPPTFFRALDTTDGNFFISIILSYRVLMLTIRSMFFLTIDS